MRVQLRARMRARMPYCGDCGVRTTLPRVGHGSPHAVRRRGGDAAARGVSGAAARLALISAAARRPVSSPPNPPVSTNVRSARNAPPTTRRPNDPSTETEAALASTCVSAADPPGDSPQSIPLLGPHHLEASFRILRKQAVGSADSGKPHARQNCPIAHDAGDARAGHVADPERRA
eukprot:gene8194-biopygen11851